MNRLLPDSVLSAAAMLFACASAILLLVIAAILIGTGHLWLGLGLAALAVAVLAAYPLGENLLHRRPSKGPDEALAAPYAADRMPRLSPTRKDLRNRS